MYHSYWRKVLRLQGDSIPETKSMQIQTHYNWSNSHDISSDTDTLKFHKKWKIWTKIN